MSSHARITTPTGFVRGGESHQARPGGFGPNRRGSMDEIAAVRARANSTLDRKAALAWPGHYHALTTFHRCGNSIALIMEDNADWNVHPTEPSNTTGALCRSAL